jgi:hypothetical protein
MNNFDQQLHKKLKALPGETLPEKDLWPAIERGIALSPSSTIKDNTARLPSFPRGWVAVAASFCFVAFLALLVAHSLNPWMQPQSQDIVASMSTQHDQQMKLLLTQYQDAPALTNDWQTQLDELADAASAIKLALKEDPNNAALIRMLHHVYQQQIALIERVHAPKWQQI